MRSGTKKTFLIMTLAAIMLLCPVLMSLSAQAAGQEAAEQNNETPASTAEPGLGGYYRSDFYYRTGEESVLDNDVILFHPDFFLEDNQQISAEMAKISVGLAAAAYKWDYLHTALDGIGFTYDGYGPEGTKGNWNRPHTVTDNDFVRYVIAQQPAMLTGDTDPSMLLIVAVQGTYGSYDWDSNFNLGTGPNHEGFYKAHDEIMADLYDCMTDLASIYDKDHIYVLATGHSRGAAVANIVAGELTYGHAYTGQDFTGLLSPENVFGYTFACPAVSKSNIVKQTEYHNIYNFNNPDDLVPCLPLDDWGYVRYGQTKTDLVPELNSTSKKQNFKARFSSLFERDYKGTPDASYHVREALNKMIPNSEEANSLAAKAVFTALAYLMKSGENKDLKTFLETAGFYMADNAWELIREGFIKFTETKDIQEMVEAFEQIYALSDCVQSWLIQTEDMNQEEFEAWRESNQEAVEEIESLFNWNIQSRQDLIDLHTFLLSKYALKYMGIDCDVFAIGNVLKGGMELFWAMIDTNGHLLQSLKDAHYPTVYMYSVNAFFLGYKGWYDYAGETGCYISTQESGNAITIGESCFQKSSKVFNLVMDDHVKYLGDNVCSTASGLTILVVSPNLVNISKNAFNGCYNISGKLTIPESVANIGVYAFLNCSGLTEIEMPAARIADGVAGHKGPFSGCSGVMKVLLTGTGEMAAPALNEYGTATATPWEYGSPEGVTVELAEGITSISEQAFYSCQYLKQITIPESVTNIRAKAFYNCQSMNGAVLPAGLTELGDYAFYNCNSLQLNGLTIPSGVQKIGAYAFTACVKIVGKLTIPGTVTAIRRSAFANCIGLTEIEMPASRIEDGIVTNASPVQSPFSDCSGVTKIRLTGTGNMAEIEYSGTAPWYFGSSEGVAVELAEGITSISEEAFYNCQYLKQITIPKSVTRIHAKAFYDCQNMNGAVLPAGLTELGDYAFYYCNSLQLNGLTIPAGVQKIGAYAFAGCVKIVGKLTIPDTVTAIGRSAFSNCQGLTEIELPASRIEDGIVANASPVQSPFSGCSGVTKIRLTGTGDMAAVEYSGTAPWYFGSPAGVAVELAEGITSISEEAFYNCQYLKQITIPESVTRIRTRAFYGCQNMNGAVLPAGLTELGDYAFYRCNSLQLNGLTIPAGVQKIGTYAFAVCQKIDGKLTIPDTVTAIGRSAFANCQGLTAIEMPASRIKDGIVTNASPVQSPFSDCSGVTKIRLTGTGDMADLEYTGTAPWYYASEEGVTVELCEGIVSISEKAFYNCAKLKIVHLPETITVIGTSAFTGSGITDVFYYALESERDGIEFNNNTKLLSATWHYAAWSEDENGWRFLYPDGSFPADSWKLLEGSWYHFDSAGYRQTGWLKADGHWYYLDADGVRQTGWQTISNLRYYLGDDGIMRTGWQKLSGVWYYFESGGAMVTGWKQISGKWYYFASGGAMQTGWQKISGKWYYFASGGAMQTGWQKISNKWYYFKDSGAMVTGWQKISDKWYYFKDSGVMATGWLNLNGKYYYFASGGVMQTGWLKINDVWYFFKPSGVMAAGEWYGGYWLNANGSWTYTYKGSWKQNAKGWWFGDTSGWYAKNCTITIDDKPYTFDANGYWVK